jgi:aspartokinase
MTAPERLGGFKILKEVTRISMVLTEDSGLSPLSVCRAAAEEKINLPYFTSVFDGAGWGLNLIVEARDEARTCRVFEEKFRNPFVSAPGSAVLSIFPHKKNPEITGKLCEVFDREGLEPDAMATSPSTISVVIREGILAKASEALFEPFSFSAYRTPTDWKLAQKGKEQLYKEVVASYQEQRPKVYGLEYYQGQDFIEIRANRKILGSVGASFRGFARSGLNLVFFATSPTGADGKDVLAFCLPASQSRAYGRVVQEMAPEVEIKGVSSVTIFSMNGPHFGDRHGIASEILSAFHDHGVRHLALSCTIASISGVVPSQQMESALKAIQERFEVPSMMRRE